MPSQPPCAGFPLKKVTISSILVRGIVFTLFALSPLSNAFCQTSETTPPEGQSIFLQHCAKCHGDKGEGISAQLSIAGPSLKAVHDPATVMTAMEVGPSHMPSFAWILSIEQMHAVADYVTQQIGVMKLPAGNLGEGGVLFRQYCATCHRTAVRGGALAFAGGNAPALTDKSAAIIAGTIRWGPGAMPAFPSSVLTDKQVASIVEYVKFVQHPPSPGGTAMNWFGPVSEGFIAWMTLLGVIAITGWIEKGEKG